MTAPYYQDDLVTLYHGDFMSHLDTLIWARAEAIVTDPPYGETSLEWDNWPKEWPAYVKGIAKALWCFGSVRMFLDHASEFHGWKYSHERVWVKQNGTGFATDKFRRVHELAALWYQDAWAGIRHDVPRVAQQSVGNKSLRSRGKTPHAGEIGPGAYVDDGTRMMTTVQYAPNEQSRAFHPTQKPLSTVTPLIEYSVPVGGLVVDPFAGSGTTLLAAKLSGRRAIGVEANEKYCEAAARRLSQQAFQFEGVGA